MSQGGREGKNIKVRFHRETVAARTSASNADILWAHHAILLPTKDCVTSLKNVCVGRCVHVGNRKLCKQIISTRVQ